MYHREHQLTSQTDIELFFKFFEHIGFKFPERKGVAFYMFDIIGRNLKDELATPFDTSKGHPAVLTKTSVE